MKPDKSAFVELCLANEVLRFGRFTLKSGRVSPYFFDAGRFNHGRSLGQLAGHYAGVLAERIKRRFMLYGPAYKGIPLAAATAIKLSEDHGLEVGCAFNRKEVKDHGEGGGLIGAPLSGNVVIIDDVITAGTSVSQSVATIKAAGATPHALIIALDRRETAGRRNLSAAQHMQRQYGIPVYSIIDLHDLIDYLENHGRAINRFGQFTAALKSYRDQYGAPDRPE
ncbi:MAG: orotate phosphoribosyltransferase [Gammaproteobacteria bacterium]|nr:orotate phosphoribosyltransferase [Gammaproteobacteria bacterium]